MRGTRDWVEGWDAAHKLRDKWSEQSEALAFAVAYCFGAATILLFFR